MSRIRSIHPGLFTDEAFVSVSMAARLLLPGIWTECDDQGVFEWKPLTLKMKIFPADNVDVAALLIELANAGSVKKFECDGKEYGAVRNFRKYQRPKKPLSRFPLPGELRTYVSITNDDSPPVPHQHPTGTEKSPQMEDEGGRREDEGSKKKEKDSRRVAVATALVGKFEEFWEDYPKRGGANPRSPAAKKFGALVLSGIDPDSIIAGMRRYAVECATKSIVGTSYVAQSIVFLNQRRWEDYPADSPTDTEPIWTKPPPGARTHEEILASMNGTGHGETVGTEVRSDPGLDEDGADQSEKLRLSG